MIVQPFHFRDFEFREAKLPIKSEPIIIKAPEPLKPRITEEQLEAVRQEAFAAGKEKGRKEAQEQVDAELMARGGMMAATMQAVRAQFEVIGGRVEEEARSQQQVMAKLALQMAHKIAGRAMDAQPAIALQDMLTQCFAMLAGEARVMVLVAATVVDEVKQLLAHEGALAGQVIEVRGDALMRAGDCRIEWQNGKAVRKIEDIWQEMEAMIERAFHLPPEHEQ